VIYNVMCSKATSPETEKTLSNFHCCHRRNQSEFQNFSHETSQTSPKRISADRCSPQVSSQRRVVDCNLDKNLDSYALECLLNANIA